MVVLREGVSSQFCGASACSGYVEVLKLKRLVKDKLLGEWLQASTFPAAAKESLRAAFSGFSSVRARYEAYPSENGEAQADTAWLLGCPESLSKFAELVNSLVYKDDYDARFRDAVKSRHEAVDFLDYPSVKRELEDVEQALRTEANPQATDDAGAGTSNPQPGDSAASKAGDDGDPGCSGQSAAAAGDFKKLSEDEQHQWRQFMLKTVNAQIRFVADQKSAADLEQTLRDSPFARLVGDPTGLVLIHFDVKKFGEAATRPDLRVTPLRDGPYSRLVRSLLNARRPAGTDSSSPATLQPGDVAVLLDGGKRGIQSKLIAPFREGTTKATATKKAEDAEDEEEGAGGEDDDEDDSKPNLVTDLLQIGYTEESLQARRKRTRGVTSLKQIEWCHVLSCQKLNLPSRPRRHYAGSSSGDLMSGVAVPPLEAEWKLSWRDKKLLYGKKNLIPVGGKTDGGAEEPATMDRNKNLPEPVCFHNMPEQWYDELLHTYYAKLVLDLSPLDGRFALQCLRNRVGYVAICFNDDHVKFLQEYLLQQLQSDMKDSKSPLFNQAFASAVLGQDGSAASADAKAKAKAKAGASTAVKAKAKTKSKAKAKRCTTTTGQGEAEGEGTSQPKKKARKADDQVVLLDDEEAEEEGAEAEEDQEDDEIWDPLA